MRTSVVISSLLHAAIIAWALTGLASTKAFDPKPISSVPVDILTPSEFTKIKAGKKDAKEEKALVKPEKKPEKKAENKKKKRKAKAVLPPPKSEPKKAVALPKPKPKKAEKKPDKQKPKPKPKKVVDKPANQQKTLPTSKTTRSQKNFDADRIAALLNKIPDAAPSGQAPSPPKPAPKTTSLGKPGGQDETMSISEIDAFRRQIESCWNPPIGGLGAERLVVRIRFEFNKDGTLKNPPRVLNLQSSPVFQAVADSAVRAIWQCQPYYLPPKKYDIWKDMTLKFDPREIYGG